MDSAVQSAQDNNVSKIQALGDININARVVNVNGLIESGIKDYVLDIAASFDALAAQARSVQTDLTLTESTTGVNFFTGTGSNKKGGQEFDVVYEHARNAIVVRDLVPQAGKVFITGTVISTGNGTIKAASGYASLDVDIDLDMDVIFEGVDLETSREGLIQITDINRLTVHTTDVSDSNSSNFGANVRTTFTLDGANVSKKTEAGMVEVG